ncbi:MAG: NAD(P)-dependent oxidoreductase [Alphaproteobacteria bacterium]|nr:NAD(P)-dependent oxidoreductase [Alphaproteobacteria bacterium]
MRVFITGATGFIGGHVAAHLAGLGYEIVALAQSEQDLLRLRERGYHPVMGNMQHSQEWRTEAAHADALIHCAMLRRGVRHGAVWLELATEAEKAALRGLIKAAMAGGRCQVIIDTSGTVAVGDHGDAWVSRSTPPRDTQMGRYHRAGEAMIQQAADDGLPACTLRVGMVYSPDGSFAQYFLKRASDGALPIIGSGDNYVSPVHIDDVCAAYEKAILSPPVGQILHVVDDHPMTMTEFGERVLQACGGGVLRHVPRNLVSVFAGAPIAEMATTSCRSTNDETREALGWVPRFLDAEQGLADVVARWSGHAA